MIVRCPDAAAFRDRAARFLLAGEQRHHLLLRISESRTPRPAAGDPEPWWLVAERSGTVVAAAAMTPPHALVVCETDDEILGDLLGYLAEAGAPLSAVNGPAAASRRFAELWAARTGGTTAVEMRLRLFSTTIARTPGGVAGRIRPADDADVPLVARWLAGFDAEALHTTTAAEAGTEHATHFIRRGGVVIWEDGEPRAMANATVPTGSGVCINAVWTPPEFRRRGYATACVAALTERLLAGGRSYVCLFTDLANPVSNSIYPKIGYAPITDFEHLRLIPPA